MALVASSITSPPMNSSALRRPIETLVPTRVWISVVSAVRRESTSPPRRLSKKIGSWRSTLAYTAARRSAVTRSPSQDTK